MKIPFCDREIEPDYIWEPTPEEIRHDNEDRCGDTADAYAVYLHPDLPGGCMTFARYFGRWRANPYSVRPLVRHLFETRNEVK